MSDVLLVNPPNDFSDRDFRNNFVLYPPNGLLYLASHLLEKTISVSFLDIIAAMYSLEESLDILKKENPMIVGITSTTPQIRGALQLAKAIKTYNRNIKIVLGGAHITADEDFIKRFRDFDLAISGEGEHTFAEICIKMLKKEEIEKRLYKGEILSDINTILFPARDLLNSKLYFIEPYGNKITTIHTSRGCPFNCCFCSKPITQRTIRYRTPENVVAEIEHCVERYDTKYVLFTDDTFTIRENITATICNLIIRKNLKIEWGCATRANLIDEELIKLMKVSGCREIAFGVESGNEELRNKIIKKQINNQDLLQAFKLCRKNGIETSAFCMLGFPGETKSNVYETLDFLKKIKPNIMGLHLTVPMPGSAIYNMAITEKKIPPDYWDNYAVGKIKTQPVYIPDGFSIEDLLFLQRSIYVKYYFSIRYLFTRLISDLRSLRRLIQDFKLGFSLLLKTGTKSGRP